MPPDRRLTAEELQQELRQQPDYFQRRRQDDLAEERRAEAYRNAIQPVLEDLAEAGFPVPGPLKLGEGRSSLPPGALAVLVRWLPRVEERAVLEVLIRALTDESAKPEAAGPLISLFRALPDDEELGLKWTVGNALSEVSDDSVFDDLVELIQDDRHGRAREMLPLALVNCSSLERVSVLREALPDPDLTGHVVIALGKLEATEALPQVATLTDHPKAWVRSEVQKTLRRLEKAAQRS